MSLLHNILEKIAGLWAFKTSTTAKAEGIVELLDKNLFKLVYGLTNL